MDVCCVRSVGGFYYSTEFFVKLKVPIYGVEHANAVFLGLADERETEATHLQMHPPFVERKQVSRVTYDDAEEDRFRTVDQAVSDKLDNHRVSFTCNGSQVSDVISYVGEGQLVHFYDALSASHSKSPSSSTLAKFPLLYGKNKIKCTHNLSHVCAEFDIWVYNSDDQLVVMDIDGTITKSDLTGYIQTVFMGVYTYVHYGLVEFLNELCSSFSYHFIYLTARPFAHKKETMQLLRSVRGRRSKDLHLPEGPLFTMKERVIVALYREVILKDTVLMKADALTHVVNVFKLAGCNKLSPFALGVGNKANDAIAYNSAGIAADRIFLIDPYSKITVWRYSQHANLPRVNVRHDPTLQQPAIKQKAEEYNSSHHKDGHQQGQSLIEVKGTSAQTLGEDLKRQDVDFVNEDTSHSVELLSDLSVMEKSSKIVPSLTRSASDSAAISNHISHNNLHNTDIEACDGKRPRSADLGTTEGIAISSETASNRSNMKNIIENSSAVFTFDSYSDPLLLRYITELYREDRL